MLLELLFLCCMKTVPAHDLSTSRFQKIKHDPAYFITASRTVRPGQVYSVVVTVFRNPLIVRASVQREGVELASDQHECQPRIPETLLLKIPPTILPGSYRLRVDGGPEGLLEGGAFHNETELMYSQRSMTIFIETDQPIYRQGQKIFFRAIPVTTDLRAFSEALDVFILDPRGTIMRRWLSRQTNLGAVSFQYQLSKQPRFGNWSIRVVAQSQVEEKTIYIEEYYQTPFEVNVTLPAFILESQPHIKVAVTANYTSGAPVTGNLTVRTRLEPLHSQYKSYGQVPETKMFFNYFEGHMDLNIPMSELRRLRSTTDRPSRLSVWVEVGERFLDQVEIGFAESLLYKADLKLTFLGDSPQIFKPSMPFKCYVSVAFLDGTLPPRWRLNDQRLELRTRVRFSNGLEHDLDSRLEQMSALHFGIWEISVDLVSELGSLTTVNNVQSMSLEAMYTDETGAHVRASLLVYASYAPTRRHLQVTTSSRDVKVGEYLIVHVRADYYVEKFYYLVVSKGIVLLTGAEEMPFSIRTFAIPCSPAMAPTATLIVWDMAREGEVVADALTFPVDGLSRNNFSVTLNDKKDKTGKTIEVIVEGQPGTYVGLSAIDHLLNKMDTGENFSPSEVLEKMNSFDGQDIWTSRTLSYSWRSRDNKPNPFVHYPSLSYGIDTLHTFQYAGLIVFTDANVPKRPDDEDDAWVERSSLTFFTTPTRERLILDIRFSVHQANSYYGSSIGIGFRTWNPPVPRTYKGCSSGMAACLDGACYQSQKRCDGFADCRDGSDESGCPPRDEPDIAEFHQKRLNRLERMYHSSWIWKDINIGPRGYTIFSVPVPSLPTTWLLGAYGMNSAQGFGMLASPVEFSFSRPFAMNVEMPSKCRTGEQIGIRITVFNYFHTEIEALVILGRSPDYRFVHVEHMGIVQSYNPRTDSNEHHHLVFVKSGKSAVVYMPIVVTTTGVINVTVMARAQMAKEVVTRPLIVKPDGIPQFRHTSVMLDLSQGAYLMKYLDTNLTATPIVPFRRERLYVFGSNRATVSVTGDFIGAVFPTVPVDTESLLKLPDWCGEQTMFNFAANLYTLLYLRLSGQRMPQLEKEAFQYLRAGYQRQLSYQLSDGSFSPFRWDTPPSVWLTAFCVRVFHQATFQEWESFLFIDPKVISKAVRWLLKQQSFEGAFCETTTYPYDRKMNLTSSRIKDPVKYRNISLTAHVLITLVEVSDLSGELGAEIVRAKRGAQRYLEKMLHSIRDSKDPYEIAIVAYALTLVNSVDGETAFNALDSKMKEAAGLRYWGREPVPPAAIRIDSNRPHLLPRLPLKYDALNVETTAYALLTHIKRQAVIQREIVHWLNAHRSTDHGWASTQDSIVAMQALMEFAIESRLRDVIDVTVTVEVPSLPGFSRSIHIDEVNFSRLQKIEIPRAFGTVVVKAQGSGAALVQLSVDYNVDWQHLITPPPVPAFHLDVRASYSGRNSSHLTIQSCQSWTLQSESRTSGMAVLEVSLPTGYIIEQHELHGYVRSHRVRNLREARFREGEIVFFFEHLDIAPICVTFTVQRWYPVANMTRYLPVKVYDYYAPERYNETMLDLYNLFVMNICQVCGSYQCPYCPIFSSCSVLSGSIVIISLLIILLHTFR